MALKGRRSVPRLPTPAVAALKAWADLDRFEVPEVPLSGEDGWAAVGVLARDAPPPLWPPRPDKAPAQQQKILDTRVMFGCCEVATLEDVLDRLFSDDLRFVQTGVRRPRKKAPVTPSRSRPQTYRGSFRVDDAGNLVPGSFEYAPLIDFARHVEYFLIGSRSLPAAVGQALAAIDGREHQLLEAWTEVVESGAEGLAATGQVLAKVRVRDDQTRYCTQWIWPDDEPAGQLPAFFRADLLQAAGQPTSALLADVVAGRPGARSPSAQDLEDRSTLEPKLSLDLIPRAAWPTGYMLRLSQQVALTAMLADGADRLTVVNGPPGTGKTTLLRDLYANLLTRRAAVMVGYQTPTAAFGAKQELASNNSQQWSLYAPAAELCGYEMVVASSNNAAVENVTKELPDAAEVRGETSRRLSYFTAAANAEPPGAVDPKTPDFRPGLLDRPAWGFAAAALGSRDRVGQFERVVGRYVKAHSKSASLLRELGRSPRPGDWEAARRRFRTASRAVDEAIASIGRELADAEELAVLKSGAIRRAQDLAQADEALVAAVADTATARSELTRYEGAANASQLRLTQHDDDRPGWFARWWDLDTHLTWQQARILLADAAAAAAADREARGVVLETRETVESTAKRWLTQVNEASRAADTRLEELHRRFASRPTRDRSSWVTADWWSRWADEATHDEVELGSAWVNAELQRLREELFLAAVEVHEVFARRCGRQLAVNLRTWLALQSNEVQRQAAEEATLAAWQSLSLLVPLVSTTFASMARLLQRVPWGSLGWLIVDEAGQSVPAAAVGGLARFGRAVVVGDPLQLEPVVTLPRALVDQLMKHHGAPDDLAPTHASVQTLADAVSGLGTVRGDRWISMPLLVHNRCLQPMFDIANEMAYDGKMVYGRTRPESANLPLGPSRWIDVPRPPGDGDHFNERDWVVVRDLLHRVDWSLPTSIAIISPFKRVTRVLQSRVPAEISTRLAPGLSDDEITRVLGSVRVGTVHTFQGREYDSVILVLGGSSPGARGWVASTPNLLNVAVTRAKDRLYVVGDYEAWARVGHAATLAKLDRDLG